MITQDRKGQVNGQPHDAARGLGYLVDCPGVALAAAWNSDMNGSSTAPSGWRKSRRLWESSTAVRQASPCGERSGIAIQPNVLHRYASHSASA